MSHGRGIRHEKDTTTDTTRHDEHDGFNFKMRLPSPLPNDVERVITVVIDCAMDVHRRLGPGFLESIYQRAMCIALAKAGIPFEQEKPIEVVYEGVRIPGQRVDLVAAGLVVVELKSVERFDEVHRAQVISYLRTMGLRAGLPINFRVPRLHLGLKRIVL
jgi:GxxExxY protein